MKPEANLSRLGLTLPVAPPAAGNYLPAVRSGNLLFCSGTLPLQEGAITHAGQVGRDVSVGEAAEGAKICVLNTLANAKAELGVLDRISRVVSVTGFVNGAAGFSESSAVVNGASDLLVAVFGPAGRHARAAMAVAGLPRNAAVEIQIVFELSS
jgi:enamine deaminase RidA (YjgF/YER057c/UK114 family)